MQTGRGGGVVDLNSSQVREQMARHKIGIHYVQIFGNFA